MGSCHTKKIQNPPQQASETYFFPNQRPSFNMTWVDKYTQQPQERIVKPYDPCCLQCQYNVDVDGVIFDVIAPPDLLDEDNLEPFEQDE